MAGLGEVRLHRITLVTFDRSAAAVENSSGMLARTNFHGRDYTLALVDVNLYHNQGAPQTLRQTP